MLSIVVPAYNEEDNVLAVVRKLNKLLEKNAVDYEIVFVNDGSSDLTWQQICKAKENNSHIKGISFSRNFGKEAAIYAGLEHSFGDAIVVMDCDLQHPPETIMDMYKLWQQGYQVVEGVKSDRGQERKIHGLAANIFYNIISKVTCFDMRNASDFKLMDRRAVDAILEMKENNGFFRVMSSWVGFRSAQVSYEVQERNAGVSKWSTKALIRYAVNNITSFTNMPLQIMFYLGIFLIFLAIVLSVATLCCWCYGTVVIWEFVLSSVLQLLLHGCVMFGLGVIGYYLAKIYDEVKGRPKYIISEMI